MDNREEYQDSIRVHLVRINSYQGNSAIALEWYDQIQSTGSRQLAWQIIKRFFPDEIGNEV
jgi:hypothetical protein